MGWRFFVCPRVPGVVSGENIMNSKTDEGSPTHPPSKKSPPQKTLFKWNWEQGETVEELAARIVAHVRNQLLKGIKPEHNILRHTADFA
jgi:hypothetical protein